MYLLRLDDASQYWDREKWQEMHKLLSQYEIKPIFAIIPHNEDKRLHQYPKDPAFLETINQWLSEGWTPALHGYCHVLSVDNSGLNPVNSRSEFSGKSLEEQKTKIREGYKILSSWKIKPQIFVAPAHTFDNNTLKALRSETPIRIISDTVANDIYFEDGFYYIPQQSGVVRKIKCKIVTFCYHPNTVTDNEMEKLNDFLAVHKNEFGSFDDLNFAKRKKNSYDKMLSRLYFYTRKIRKILKV